MDDKIDLFEEITVMNCFQALRVVHCEHTRSSWTLNNSILYVYARMHTRDEGGNVEPTKPYNAYWSSSDNQWRYKRRPPPCSGPFCLQKVDVVRACLLLQVVVSDSLSSLSVAGAWILDNF